MAAPLRLVWTAAAAAILGIASALGAPARAAEGAALLEHHWPFEGVFGHFDRAAAQRGLQIYREVCSSCHS